mmetsp:Transcript_22671/g.74176  ORF Transcript_22671/g.74176 Transcript_22671/m.74176 type:complete len:235 (+) Transcript_22671:157-861(+)
MLLPLALPRAFCRTFRFLCLRLLLLILQARVLVEMVQGLKEIRQPVLLQLRLPAGPQLLHQLFHLLLVPFQSILTPFVAFKQPLLLDHLHEVRIRARSSLDSAALPTLALRRLSPFLDCNFGLLLCLWLSNLHLRRFVVPLSLLRRILTFFKQSPQLLVFFLQGIIFCLPTRVTRKDGLSLLLSFHFSCRSFLAIPSLLIALPHNHQGRWPMVQISSISRDEKSREVSTRDADE